MHKSIVSTFARAFARYRVHIVLLIGLGFLSGLLEGIGISAIIPLFSFIVEGQSAGTDFISRFLVGAFAYLPFAYSIGSLLALIVALFVLRAVVLVIFNYMRARISTSYMIRTMNDLLERTLSAQWGYLIDQRLGYAELTLTRDVRQAAALLEAVSQGVLVFTSLIIYTIVALNISLPITIATGVSGAVLLLLLQPLRKRVRRVAGEAARLEKGISHFLNEHTLGMKTIKSAAVESEVFKRGLRYFEEFKKTLVKSTLLQSLGSSSIQPLSLVFICGIFFYLHTTSALNLGAFVALIYLIQKIFVYVEAGQSALHSINEKVPYVENTLRFRDLLMAHEEEKGGSGSFAFQSELRFTDVAFAYESRKQEPVFTGISFSLRKGEMVGLIGPSGVGKTSIADLLLRLYRPASGSITLDGRGVEDISLRQWRRRVGYVSQDMFLLNDSIKNNIRFYDESISDAALEEAAAMANATAFISKLDRGFDTVVGERGAYLSAGQRQRIILARVLARNPQLLILDEATSALDNESEVLIQKAIDDLKGKVTVFVIAHRLSTVMHVDSLLVLKGGELTMGTPQEMLKDTQSYLYQMHHLKGGSGFID